MALDRTEKLQGNVVELPADYQTKGMDNEIPDESNVLMDEEGNILKTYGAIIDEVDMEHVDVATIDNWLGNAELPREWIYLPSIGKKVLIEAMTDEERIQLNKKAPKIFDKRTKRTESDSNWVLYETLRRKIIEPKVPTKEMLSKALAGDLALIATKITELSGFTRDTTGGAALG